SGTAAGKSLRNAGPLVQIDHKVEELEAPSFFLPLNKFLGKAVVLLHDLGQILLADRIRLLGIRHHRLDRKLFKAQVGKMKNVFGEIQIVPRKGSPDKIVLCSSGFREFLE